MKKTNPEVPFTYTAPQTRCFLLILDRCLCLSQDGNIDPYTVDPEETF